MALLTLTLNIRNMKYHCFSSFFLSSSSSSLGKACTSFFFLQSIVERTRREKNRETFVIFFLCFSLLSRSFDAPVKKKTSRLAVQAFCHEYHTYLDVFRTNVICLSSKRKNERLHVSFSRVFFQIISLPYEIS